MCDICYILYAMCYKPAHLPSAFIPNSICCFLHHSVGDISLSTVLLIFGLCSKPKRFGLLSMGSYLKSIGPNFVLLFTRLILNRFNIVVR